MSESELAARVAALEAQVAALVAELSKHVDLSALTAPAAPAVDPAS